MFVRLAGAAAASAGRACTLSFSCVSRMVLPSAFFLQLCPSRLRRALLASAARTFKPAWCASSRRSDSRSACTSFTGALATPASPSGGESSKRVAEGSHVPEESGHLPVEEIQSSTCKWRQHPFKRYVSGLQLGGAVVDRHKARQYAPAPGGQMGVSRFSLNPKDLKFCRMSMTSVFFSQDVRALLMRPLMCLLCPSMLVCRPRGEGGSDIAPRRPDTDHFKRTKLEI